MQFSYDWLKTWVHTDLTPEAFAHLLTMSGLEVEESNLVAPMFTGVVVAEVKALEAHPNADRLRVTRVDAGTGEWLQIVCGAPNVEIGMKVPCALSGALLPGNFAIKPTKMRGVESCGMLCSAKELGLPEDVDGLLALPADAPVGQNIREYLNLDDTAFLLKITPNRADCLSIKGIAREVGALTHHTVQPVNCAPVNATIQDVFPVHISAPEACGRFAGRMIKGVNAKAKTPDWMKTRLERSGLRSISALVDITNYILLELGQPMHAFDFAKLHGGINVRFAAAGEQLQCLNDKTVTLIEDTLVVADQQKALSIAGFMGGAESAVSDETHDVFFESAYFAPEVIAGKSRVYGFSSDSAFRFERGVDFAGQHEALERATALVLEICGGAAGPVVEATGNLPKRNQVNVRLARVNQILGVAVPESQVVEILQHLGLQPQKQAEGVYQVTAPTFRFDIEIEEDLIEEIGRIFGYENIPDDYMQGSLSMLRLPENQESRLSVYQNLAMRDYQEVVNYAFVNKDWELDFAANTQPIALQNPIASQMSVMRSTLLGGLIEVLQNNLNRKQSRVRIFEVARIFTRNEDQSFHQVEKIAGLAYGSRLPEQWGVPTQKIDFYDVKADVESLFAPKTLRFEPVKHPALHPGRAAQIFCDGQIVGIMGELHPLWVQKYDLNQVPVVFELDFQSIIQKEKPQYQPTSKFQAVRRDLAFVLPEKTSAQALLDALAQAKTSLVQQIALFDVYQGQGIEAGMKSLAVKVILQAQDKTLSDTDVEAVIDQMLSSAAVLGAKLRA